MKQQLIALSVLIAGIFVACNKDVTPPIPVIYEYDITVVDNADTPISDATVEVYMPHKPEFVVMSKTTNIFGKIHFLNLKPGEYTLKSKFNDTELAETPITVSDDNSKNSYTIKADKFTLPVSSLKIIVKSDRGAAISERKIDLVTKDGGIIYKSGLTDDNGTIIFDKLPLKEYFLKVYDDMNEFVVITDEVTIVEDATKNVSNVEIVKLIHFSDIVITGMMVDPKGSDSPKPGTVSGGGFTHPGGYEYIQLLALKDINFDQTPYCVVTGMNVTSPDDKTYPAAVKGWIQSKGQTSKTTYQMNLTTGSVKKGEIFYVGGTSYMIAGYYDDWGSPTVPAERWWAFDWYNKAGNNDNGMTKGGSGIFNNLSKGSNTPDGIAVFKGIDIDENTIPQDVVFYGAKADIRKEDRYRIADNDLYRTVNSKGESQPYFGDGTNIWFAEQDYNDDGCFIMMGGIVTPTEWLKPRIGKAISMNVKQGENSVSLADIESNESVTQFIDK